MSNKPSSSARLPDLYKLLSLKPLESDRGSIEAALERLAQQVKSAELASGDAEQIAKAKRLWEFGRKQLLSAPAKQRYDRQWREAFAAPDVGHSSRAEATLEERLLRLLPGEDPTEPFRLADYLQAFAAGPVASYQADFEKLQSVLRSAATAAEPRAAVSVAAPATATATATATAAVLPETLDRSEQPSSLSATGRRSVNAMRQQRKRREQWWLWGAIGSLASLALGLGAYFLSQSPSSSAVQERLAATELATAADRNTASSAGTSGSASERRSGLPSVVGVDSGLDLTMGSQGLMPVPSEPVVPAGDSPLTGNMPSATENPLASQTPPASNEPSSISEPPASATPAMSTPPATVELTADELAAWQSKLSQTRQLIGQQAYAQAEQQLSSFQPLAKNDDQQRQLQRLQTVNRLASELQQAITQVLANMEAGEVVTIGTSTPVAFVGWDGNVLSIRLRGENRKFALSEMPIGLVFGLADMALPVDNPSTQARKAAFTAVHPGAAGNPLAQQRGREMMIAAAAAGVVDSDLVEIFNAD